jgi:RNA polymerase sigma-70 factor, ECF subfamily
MSWLVAGTASVMASPLPTLKTGSYPWQEVAPSTSDPELDAIKAGDEAAFEAMITRYHGPLLRMAMAYVRDHGVAEDVVQETWLTFLRTLDRFEGRSSLKTWIFGILMNIAKTRRRKESRILPFASFFQRDGSPSGRSTVDPHRFGSDGMWASPPSAWTNLPEAAALNQEALEQVKSAIGALPERLREVVILRDVAGLESDEVCRLLAISAANQRVRLHRGRAAVRRMLEEYAK